MSMVSFILIIQVKMTKSSVFLLLRVGQVCLIRHSFFHRLNSLVYTYTAATHGFYTYSLLYPMHAVCCSKLPKLPPNQCCVALQGTEATTRSVLYAVWSYHSLYVGTSTATFYYLTLLTVTCLLLQLHSHQKAALVHFHLLQVHVLLHHLQLHLTYVQ